MKPTPAAESNPAVIWACAIIDALVECGLQDVIISPGSRSTPLVVAASEDARLRDHSVIDERSAAFVALGLAQASGRPVALICTSGTAAANYYPAVCEANHGRVPVILLTADRPPRLRDSGASQAMRQVGLYGEHVRWAHDLGMPSEEAAELKYARSIARRAYSVARDEHGPVHLNLPFDKPLDPQRSGSVASGPLVFEGRTGPVYQPVVKSPDPHAMTEVVRLIESASRPVFVVGSSRTAPNWARVLNEVAGRIGAPILAEATSQLRFGESSEHVVPADLVVADRMQEGTLKPDLVVRLGRAPINWPVIRWLDSLDAQRIVVSEHRACDPDASADMIFVGDELAFLDALRRRLPDTDAPSEWRREFSDHGHRARAFLAKQFADAPLVDGTAAHDLAELVPEDGAIVLSSSMPLREFETFAVTRKANLRVFCNRGLNGIDGVVSTAFGVACATSGPTALLIGDVAMAHDLAALQLTNRLGVALTIVLVDNGGGAIFDHLPLARVSGVEETFQQHFTTTTQLQWEASAELFGVSVTAVTDRSSYRDALTIALGSDGVDLIVVRTDKAEAKAFRDQIFSDFGEASE